MKKQLVVPKFKNEDQESEFWANLDLTEYFEPADFKRGVVFPNLKRTKKLISIRLPEQLLLKVKHKATKLHMPYQALMQQLIQQGVEKV
ncbi:MAG TPA: BrnA antitoxin family protein [Candidatus Saccharimonadales bacterium]|nr:BrnA antitoxin family protein [Candidatus Saccharimonadales bacterium]